jgi:hypothetical protein
MHKTIRCLSCDARFLDAVGPCALCGGIIELSIALSGAAVTSETGRLGTVADSFPPQGGRKIEYTAPTGSRSDSSLNGSLLNIKVTRPVDIGRKGEPRVLACIQAFLEIEGKKSFSLFATDSAGEDGVLQIDKDRVTIQIVTVSPSKGFWGTVAKGDGAVKAELTETVEWIYGAISEKGNLYPKENKLSMLLAVDVAHMGVLSGADFCKQYLITYSDPSACFDFGGVWLVGPTESHVLRLGSSRW